jgi:predicted helicase
MMAGKSRLMADIIEKSLNEDDSQGNVSNLKRQMLSFQKMLISDIDNKSYSDLYSQTIAYGLFAARYHDPSLPTFSREEALKLIPRSNPFLRKLFKDIADDELDHRIVWIVDELVNVFLASDVSSIMKDFGKSTKQEDPVVHFYETFLGAYNPALRKARGVWYTPAPVVNFIVRAVDDILKTEFGLKEGLADTSKKKVKVNYQGKQIEKEVHQVQILDPATGTGTFLAETIKHIHKKYEGMQGIWSKYVEDDLIPRLNGFELLMASYAMAHLKLDMLLTETGYIPTRDQRLKVFLTNSLEEPNPDSGTLWGNLLSDEADQANEVKRDTPVMCVIGNPPYSGVSSNNGKWISDLIEDYKYVDGVHFNERKHWLNDDYVKFLRFGEHFIEKNGQGVLAFINPHGFLDNPTFRGMRWHLLKTFDKIYTIDLHGNSKKKETAPDGSADINVFDIMQGVSINIFVKTGRKNKANESGKVFHYDLYGKREMKYDFLSKNSLKSIDYDELKPNQPNYFFIPKNDDGRTLYETGFGLETLFLKNVTGIVTMGDGFILDDKKEKLKIRLEDFLLNLKSEDSLNREFNLGKNYSKWILENRSGMVLNEEKFIQIAYRPFDNKWTYFDNKLIWRWRIELNKHFFNRQNIGLVIPRFNKEDDCFFISKNIIAHKLCSAYDSNSLFPLYLYSDINTQQTIGHATERTPNLNTEIVRQVAENLGLTFTNEKEKTNDTFAPLDILDYIYAVLHAPSYRQKYKEFLKIDFPRVPYPKDKETFWKLVKLGGQIREIHLLESDVVEKPIAKYPIAGNNVVGKIKYDEGKVFINETQYFEGVPEVAWNFYIGGYQPAQKWLKDRKDRELQVEDIKHYLKIVVALNETDRLMKEIDKVEIE